MTDRYVPDPAATECVYAVLREADAGDELGPLAEACLVALVGSGHLVPASELHHIGYLREGDWGNELCRLVGRDENGRYHYIGDQFESWRNDPFDPVYVRDQPGEGTT